MIPDKIARDRIGARHPSPPLEPGLYVVATPIGNLRDITLRALDILAAADRVYAEDTRVTRKLLDAYGLKPQLGAYHEHNAEARARGDSWRAGARRERGADLRRRHAAGFRSRLQAGARRDRGGPSRVPDPRRFGAARGLGGVRACRPTASCSRASCRRSRARAARHWRSWREIDATLDLLRNRPAPGGSLCRHGRSARAAARSGCARTDQAVRGNAARHARCAGRALRRSGRAERGDRRCRRPAAAEAAR